MCWLRLRWSFSLQCICGTSQALRHIAPPLCWSSFQWTRQVHALMKHAMNVCIISSGRRLGAAAMICYQSHQLIYIWHSAERLSVYNSWSAFITYKAKWHLPAKSCWNWLIYTCQLINLHYHCRALVQTSRLIYTDLYFTLLISSRIVHKVIKTLWCQQQGSLVGASFILIAATFLVMAQSLLTSLKLQGLQDKDRFSINFIHLHSDRGINVASPLLHVWVTVAPARHDACPFKQHHIWE